MTVESPTSPRPSPPPGAPGAEREREKGPLVFLDYDQAELDAAYNQSAYQPNIQQLRDRWVSNNERTRQRIGAPLRLPYGPSAIEQLDIFRTERDAAPFSSSSMAAHGARAWPRP